ncbi:MAG: hypothetical protein JNJ94_12590, partial [Chlorobi bacterium]|nr:hypothetical protein [Chlorobiota bacterium]
AVGGKTGSEAGVALRNVLGLVQKASGPAEAAMGRLGTSSKELGQLLTTQGLGPALQKLQSGMNALGTDAERNATLMTIFGTENSAAAGILLENVDKLAEFESGILAGEQGIGDAFAQAQVRMDTVESKMSRFSARMKDLAITAFGTIGDGLAGFVGILGQAAPALATVSNLKLLIPTDFKFDTSKLTGTLQGKLEGLATSFGPSVKKRFSDALSGAFDAKDAGAKLRTALGSIFRDGASVAGKQLGGLGKGLAGLSGIAKQAGGGIASGFKGISGFLGPAAPWVVGITLAVGLFTLLYNKSEKFRAAIDGLVSKLKAGFEKVVSSVGPIFEQVLGILGEIGALMLDFLITPVELLVGLLSGVGDVIGGWLAPLVGAGDAAGFFQKVMEGIELVLVMVKSNIEGLKAAWESVKTSIGDGFGKLFSGDVVGAFDSFTSVGSNASEAFNNAFKEGIDKGATEIVARHLKETLENASKSQSKFKQAEELDKLIDKYEKTTDVFKKNQLALEIQKIAPAAVKNFKMVEDSQGKLVKVYDVSIDAARRFEEQQRNSAKSAGEGLPENFLNGIEAQIKLYDDAKKSLAELQEQRAQKVATGGSTEDIDKQIADQVKGIEKMKTEVESRFGEGVKLGLLKNLPEEGEERLQALRQKFPVVFSQIESDAAQSGIGTALTKAVSIKGELDKTGSLKKLVEDFRKAGTEAEKSSIAKKIQEQIPEAVNAVGTFVDAHGNIQTAYKLDEKAADNYFKSQEQALGADAASNAVSFREQLLLLADQYGNLKQRIAETRDKLNNSTDPAERARYRQELIQLTEQANKLGGAIGKTVVEGRKFGFVKGDVKQVSSELGASTEQSDALTEGMARVGQETDKAKVAAQDLGEAYDAAGKALQESLDASVLTILANEAEIARLTGEIAQNFNNPVAVAQINGRIAELRKQNDELKSQSKGQVIQIEERKRRKDVIEVELGIQDPKAPEKKEGKGKDTADAIDFSDELKKIAEDTANIITDIRLAGVEDEIAKEKAIRSRAADDAIDQASENLAAQLKAVDEAKKEGKAITPIEVMVDGKLRKITAPDEIKDAFRRATQDQINAIRAQEGVDLARIEQEGLEKKKAALRQIVAEERKAVADSYRAEAEGLQKRLELIKGNSADEIRLRYEIKQRQIELERDAATETALAENDVFVENYTNLQQLQQQLDETEDEAEREKIRQSIARQRVALATTRQQLLQSNEVLLAIQKDFDTKSGENTTTKDRELYRVRNLERIAAIKNAAEQEKELALFNLRDKYEEEYSAAVGNAAKQEELTRKFLEEKRKIEEDYLTKTDTLYRVSLNFRDALLDVFLSKQERQNKAEIDLEREKLDTQEKDLAASLHKREISYQEYSDKVAELNEQRQELEKSGEVQNSNLLIAIRDNTLKVFEKLAEKEQANNVEAAKKVIDTGVTTALTREKRERESRKTFEKEQESYKEELVKSKKSEVEITEALQEREEGFKTEQTKQGLKEEQEAGDARVELLEQSAATMGVQLSKLALSGKITMEDVQATVLGTAFETIQALTLSYAAPILASATSFLGPVAGPIAAALLTGVLQGLLSTARGALGLKKGKVKIKGPGGPEDDLIPANLSAGESVLTAKATAAGSNASILEWANATGRPIVENPEVLSSIHIGRFSSGGLIDVPKDKGGILPPSFNAVPAVSPEARGTAFNSVQLLSFATQISGKKSLGGLGGLIDIPNVRGGLFLDIIDTASHRVGKSSNSALADDPKDKGELPTQQVASVENDLDSIRSSGIQPEQVMNALLTSGRSDELTQEAKAMHELANVLKQFNISFSPSLPRRFSEGAVAIDGPGTMTSDSIPAYLSFKESVMTGKATMAGGEGPLGNANVFRWANANGQSILDYPPLKARLAEMPIMPDLDRDALQEVSISMIGGRVSDAQSDRKVRQVESENRQILKTLEAIHKELTKDSVTKENSSGYSITKVSKKVQRAKARRG